jgi:hypothetical protein
VINTANPQAFVVDDFTLTAVPEPATVALLGLALVGLAGLRPRSSDQAGRPTRTGTEE